MAAQKIADVDADATERNRTRGQRAQRNHRTRLDLNAKAATHGAQGWVLTGTATLGHTHEQTRRTHSYPRATELFIPCLASAPAGVPHCFPRRRGFGLGGRLSRSAGAREKDTMT